MVNWRGRRRVGEWNVLDEISDGRSGPSLQPWSSGGGSTPRGLTQAREAAMDAPRAAPPSLGPTMCESEVVFGMERRCFLAIAWRGHAVMTCWAVWSGSPHSQWWGSSEVGRNLAEYSPVKACVVSKWIPVEITKRGCVARPRVKGGILPSGGDVRARLAGWSLVALCQLSCHSRLLLTLRLRHLTCRSNVQRGSERPVIWIVSLRPHVFSMFSAIFQPLEM
jgi:hypothetical protein